MTETQLSEAEAALAWVCECLGADCEIYERSQTVVAQLQRYGLVMADLLHALRHAHGVVGTYDGGCYVIRGPDIDGETIHVVIAPRSVKNRIRFVTVWR